MAKEVKFHAEEASAPIASEKIDVKSDPLMVDEFDIVELEDRLELAGRCNGKCSIN